MTNVSNFVEKYVSERPFLEEALSKGIINNAALAEELIPLIELDLKKKVTFSSVNMAIRRLSEKIVFKVQSKKLFSKNCDISLKGSLFELTIYKTENTQKQIEKLYHSINMKEGDFITIAQGLNELTIIVNKKYEKKINELFSENAVKKKIDNLSCVTVGLPENYEQTVGIFYILIKSLSWNNISILEIFSTFSEVNMVVSEENAAKAFEILRKVIQNN